MNRWAFFAIAWIGLMFASLQLQRIDMGHAFCGAWGCGPPASALLSMHAFWFALILPPVIYMSRFNQFPWKRIGLIVALGSSAALIGFGVYDYFGVNRAVYDSGHIWQRYLLSLASVGVNVPIVQLLAAGIALFCIGRPCPCCEKSNTKPVLDSLATANSPEK